MGHLLANLVCIFVKATGWIKRDTKIPGWSRTWYIGWIEGLTHWGRETYICVGKWTIITSDSGLSPGRHQAIIWTNAGILLTGPLGTNFSEILIVIQTFSFKKMDLKISSAKWRPFCLGLNVLRPVPEGFVVTMHERAWEHQVWWDVLVWHSFYVQGLILLIQIT